MNLVSKAPAWLKMAGTHGWRFVRARGTSLAVLLGAVLVVVGFFLPWYEERTQSIIPGTCFGSCYDFTVNGWANALAPWQPGLDFGSSSVVASFAAFLPLLLALPAFAFGVALMRGRAPLWLHSLSGAGAIAGVFLLADLVDEMRDIVYGGPGIFVCYLGYIVLLVALVLAIGDVWWGRGATGMAAPPLAFTAACCALLASATFFLGLFAPSLSENHFSVSSWSNFLIDVSQQDTFGQMLAVVLPLLLAVIFATVLAGVGVLLLLVRPTGAMTAWYVVPVSLTTGAWYLGEVLYTFYYYHVLPLTGTHQLNIAYAEWGQGIGFASHFFGLMGAIALVLWHVRAWAVQTTMASGAMGSMVAIPRMRAAPWWRTLGEQRTRALAMLLGVALVILGFVLPWERESALRHSGCRWGCDGATVNGLTNAFAPFQDGTHLTGDAFAAAVTAWVPALVCGVLRVGGRTQPSWLLSLGIASAALGTTLLGGFTSYFGGFPLHAVSSGVGLAVLFIGYLVVLGFILLAMPSQAVDGRAPRYLRFFAAGCALLGSVSWATALFWPDLVGENDWSRASKMIFAYGSPWQQFSRAVPFTVDVLAMGVPLLVGLMLLWRPPARWSTALLMVSVLFIHPYIFFSFVGIHHLYTTVLMNADWIGWGFVHDLVQVAAMLLGLAAAVALVLWHWHTRPTPSGQADATSPDDIAPLAERASQ